MPMFLPTQPGFQVEYWQGRVALTLFLGNPVATVRVT
jgi:hypothetical protein